MLNWDDLKFFLAVCRAGSVRSAAITLKVNHTTVSRRINSFELALGQRLFERTSQGYVKTKLADEIYNEASYLEERLNTVERKIIGRDDELSGDIRVTLPEILATELLMPGFAKFCHLYPEIDIEIIESVKELNLANREADVAFRIVKQPPDYLVGRKIAVLHRACYLSKKLAHKLSEPGWLEQQNWIGWTDKLRKPIGLIAKEYPRFSSKHKIANAQLQSIACKEGMGIAILPCFKADLDDELVRIPPYISEAKYDLWILSHPDMRKNNKIQSFVRFMTEYLANKNDLIEGREFTR
ncbi:MAG: LysR family transcriptional regulator [Colwellia sp.]|nr:LysR family transcriptional regulator [Colwellia sp.]